MNYNHLAINIILNLASRLKEYNFLYEPHKIPREPDQWRLFIESLSISLKGVLLKFRNKFPSTPVAHSVQLKESHGNIKMLLEKFNCHCYQCICGDFKMFRFIMELQSIYNKYSCFLLLWDSRADDQNYTRKQWSTRKNLVSGTHDIMNEPLVSKEKILLPSLHIKL